jgi:hypothetical protein
MDKFLYDEIFLVGTDSTVTTTGELTVCESFEELLVYLRTKNISVNSDLRILHGVLTSAKTIPKDLMGRQPFIILKDPDSKDHGILLDSSADDNYTELATEIEEALESEEVASFFFEIDDVYVLYGYELSLALAVDEDDIDEAIISDCLEIGESARKLSIEGDD